MAAIQATAATTLSPWPYRREAAGKNTRWNGKLPEPQPTLLRDAQKSREIMMYLSSFDIFRKDHRGNHRIGRRVLDGLGNASCSVEGVEDAADHPERPVHTHEEYRHPDNVPPRERGEEAA